MSDDPFGDLDSALDEDADEETADTPGESPDESNRDARTDGQPPGPAFDYDDVTQRPLYARESSWNAFEDALALDVERTLREHGVRDAPKRELHDAALRVLAEQPDELAAAVLKERGMNVSPRDEDDE